MVARDWWLLPSLRCVIKDVEKHIHGDRLPVYTPEMCQLIKEQINTMNLKRKYLRYRLFQGNFAHFWLLIIGHTHNPPSYYWDVFDNIQTDVMESEDYIGFTPNQLLGIGSLGFTPRTNSPYRAE
jgi:hypothetical protein